jgi:hypothetical protein
MSITLDGQALFDEQQLEIEAGTFSRDSVERAAPGLDGVLSIDMGGRGRQIKQTGVLRARSRAELNDKIEAISAYMDGETHTLIIGRGEEFGELRMDAFKAGKERTSGGGVAVDYEIVYTQLKVW